MLACVYDLLLSLGLRIGSHAAVLFASNRASSVTLSQHFVTIPVDIVTRFKTSRCLESFGARSSGSVPQLVGELTNIVDYFLAGNVLSSPPIHVIIRPTVLQPL